MLNGWGLIPPPTAATACAPGFSPAQLKGKPETQNNCPAEMLRGNERGAGPGEGVEDHGRRDCDRVAAGVASRFGGHDPGACRALSAPLASAAGLPTAYTAQRWIRGWVLDRDSAAARIARTRLRAGFCTSAAEHGASIFKMMDVSRHKVDTLRGYVRRADSFKDHAGAAFLYPP